MNLKNIGPLTLYPALLILSVLFLSAFDVWHINALFLLLPALVLLYDLLWKKSEAESILKFYQAVNLQCSNRGLKLKRQSTSGEGREYIFQLPAGISKSDCEKHKEALQQYLNKTVEFSFRDNLKIKIFDKPPEY